MTKTYAALAVLLCAAVRAQAQVVIVYDHIDEKHAFEWRLPGAGLPAGRPLVGEDEDQDHDRHDERDAVGHPPVLHVVRLSCSAGTGCRAHSARPPGRAGPMVPSGAGTGEDIGYRSARYERPGGRPIPRRAR